MLEGYGTIGSLVKISVNFNPISFAEAEYLKLLVFKIIDD
jgi:hypothetical protein